MNMNALTRDLIRLTEEAEKAAEEYRKEYEEKMREELEGGVADSMLQMIP